VALVKRRLTLLAALVSAIALVASGCGSSDESSSSSDTSPTAEWANSLCTVLVTWTSAMSSIGGSLTSSGLSKEGLTSAADDVKSANEDLVAGLSGLGKPDTEAGQEAKDSLDQLSEDLKTDTQKIQDAVDGATGLSGVLSAVPVVTATLTTMGSQLSSTFQGLEQLDAKGELKDAFEQSSACKDLVPPGS
jgi:hypothetical protein